MSNEVSPEQLGFNRKKVPVHEFIALAAILVSSTWHESWLDHKNNRLKILRRYALKCRLRAVVVHDRITRSVLKDRK